MAYKLSITVDWQGALDRERVFDLVRAADEAGVHSVWAAEAWGRDAFTMMTQLVERTRNIHVGSAIVNIFSRTPAALAQHFATLDELSGGRMIIGLGTSGANVIEHFHGVPFAKPLTRMREYIDIINMLVAGKPLTYGGEIFNLQRGFTLRFEKVREHIPIFIASITPKSQKQTAEIADGWLPIWTPIDDLPGVIAEFRGHAAAAGRDPAGLMVRAPGAIVITKNVERARAANAGSFAFYMARMGVFYHQHMTRLGYGTEAGAIRAAWEEGGAKAGAAAVPPGLQQALGFVTDSIEAARERLAQQEAAGVDLHHLHVDADTPQELQKAYEALVR